MKKSVRKWSVIAVVSALVGALLAIPAPALATNRGVFILTGSASPVTKSYPAFTAPATNTGTGVMNPTTCREVHKFCDQIIVRVDPEKRYFLYSVRVTLTWPNPKSATNTTGNDLNIAVWEQDPEIVYCCRNSRTTSTTDYPEFASFGTDNPDPADYILIVDNTAGTNTGYTLKAEFVPTELGPDYAGPDNGDDPQPSFSPIPRKTSSPAINPAFDLGGANEDQETITVKVPGPDGELIDVEIPLVKAAGVSKKGETSSPVVPIILGILGLGFVLFLYFFVWRRRRQETA